MLHAILCDCEYSTESIVISSKCTHCIKREETPWYQEISTIKILLNQYDTSHILADRLLIIKKIFEYILTRPIFMSKNNIFRNVILSKIEEFRNNDGAAPLFELLDKTKIFIVNLSIRDDYCV